VTARPVIDPAASAAIAAKIPARLVVKLDADPAMAERWTWQLAGSAWTVTTDKGETVRLPDTVVRTPDEVVCTCLLQPRCIHVAAVVAVLAPAEVVAASPASASAAEATPGPTVTTQPSASAPEVGAAQHAFRVAAEVLASGSETTGTFAQAEMLRAIHACRSAGLHRLAAAQTRALHSIRALRADRAEFSLAALTSDLRDILFVAWAIGGGDRSVALVGTARRDYLPIGSLRLRGVFSEAIVARSGYTGVVTYLVTESGSLYTRSDVGAGDAGRAAGAYDAPAGIGDAVVAHRELCRSGLFVSDATASADGRLGAGNKVRAVRASEPSRWDQPAIASRWQVPLRDQLARLADADASPDELRPAGWDLVFVDGVSAGTTHGGVAFDVGGTVMTLTTTLGHRELASRENLIAISRAPGLRLRVIARARIGSPRRLDLLAFAPGDGETRVVMPEALQGRVNAHYDRFQITLSGHRTVATDTPAADDLGSRLRNRVERVVRGGIGTLPTHAIAEIQREAQALTERALGGAAEVLRDLAAAAHDAGRAMTGARRAVDRSTFARAWLRAAIYEDAVRRRLSIAAWG